MTENLRLVGPKTLTSTDSDVLANYALPASSTSGWCTSSDADTCYNTQNVLYSNNSTYGTYYSWVAATAGSGLSLSTGNATSSICPKQWRLPSKGDIETLINYHYSTISVILEAPTSFVLSGTRDGDISHGQGYTGYYWSSLAGAGMLKSAYGLSYNNSSSSYIYPSFRYDKRLGMTIRCMVK